MSAHAGVEDRRPARDDRGPRAAPGSPRRGARAVSWSIRTRALSIDELAGRLIAGPADPVPPDGRRRAAVAALFHEDHDGPHVLLMRRVERARDPWSGHVSLPGGRHEPGDVDLRATAIRETAEELAVDLVGARYLGRKPALHPHSAGPDGIEVTPFVFVADARPVVTPGPEAQAAFWLPVGAAVSGALDGTYEYPGPPPMRFPCWRHQGHVVWGLTMSILVDLFGPRPR